MTVRRLRITACCLIVYGAISVIPGFMGSVVDKADGSFQGQMTAIGGRAVQLRALQTVKWAESTTGAQHLNICEIGPGRGIIARIAQERGHRYYAIDMDVSVIERVAPYATDTYCQRVPPMPDGMPLMDAIVCENVLEHVSGYNEASAMIQAYYEALKPGGCLILRCPDVRRMGWNFWESAQDHQYVTGLKRVTTLCRESGFEIQRCGGALDNMVGIPAGIAYAVKCCFPWRLMHNLFYAPWQTSPWSTLAEKTLHCYVVAYKVGPNG